MAWKLLALLSLLGGASAAASEQSIEDLMASLKGMPGMEGIKMFTVRPHWDSAKARCPPWSALMRVL
eukprot:scaffold35442_cov36-Tisochrysis_lutea.AAC.2